MLVSSSSVFFMDGNDECVSSLANVHFISERPRNGPQNPNAEMYSSIICLRDMSYYQR